MKKKSILTQLTKALALGMIMTANVSFAGQAATLCDGQTFNDKIQSLTDDLSSITYIDINPSEGWPEEAIDVTDDGSGDIAAYIEGNTLTISYSWEDEIAANENVDYMFKDFGIYNAPGLITDNIKSAKHAFENTNVTFAEDWIPKDLSDSSVIEDMFYNKKRATLDELTAPICDSDILKKMYHSVFPETFNLSFSSDNDILSKDDLKGFLHKTSSYGYKIYNQKNKTEAKYFRSSEFDDLYDYYVSLKGNLSSYTIQYCAVTDWTFSFNNTLNDNNSHEVPFGKMVVSVNGYEQELNVIKKDKQTGYITLDIFIPYSTYNYEHAEALNITVTQKPGDNLNWNYTENIFSEKYIYIKLSENGTVSRGLGRNLKSKFNTPIEENAFFRAKDPNWTRDTDYYDISSKFKTASLVDKATGATTPLSIDDHGSYFPDNVNGSFTVHRSDVGIHEYYFVRTLQSPWANIDPNPKQDVTLTVSETTDADGKISLTAEWTGINELLWDVQKRPGKIVIDLPVGESIIYGNKINIYAVNGGWWSSEKTNVPDGDYVGSTTVKNGKIHFEVESTDLEPGDVSVIIQQSSDYDRSLIDNGYAVIDRNVRTFKGKIPYTEEKTAYINGSVTFNNTVSWPIKDQIQVNQIGNVEVLLSTNNSAVKTDNSNYNKYIIDCTSWKSYCHQGTNTIKFKQNSSNIFDSDVSEKTVTIDLKFDKATRKMSYTISPESLDINNNIKQISIPVSFTDPDTKNTVKDIKVICDGQPELTAHFNSDKTALIIEGISLTGGKPETLHIVQDNSKNYDSIIYDLNEKEITVELTKYGTLIKINEKVEFSNAFKEYTKDITIHVNSDNNAPLNDFVLKDENGNIIGTATSDENGDLHYEITVTAKDEGSRKYTVVQNNDDINGYIVDTTKHDVTVIINVDEDKNITVTVDSDVKIKNKIKEHTKEIIIHVDSENDAPINDFILKDEAGNIIGTATPDENGDLHYEIIMTVNDEGTHKYTVIQDDKHINGYTVDTTENDVTVTIKVDEDKNIAVTVDSDIKVNNKVKEHTEEIIVHVSTEDDVPLNNFVLKDDKGNVIDTVAPDENGDLHYEITITPSDEGPHTYTIIQKDNDIEGYKVDTKPHEIEVIVNVDEDENISVSVDAEVTINNKKIRKDDPEPATSSEIKQDDDNKDVPVPDPSSETKPDDNEKTTERPENTDDTGNKKKKHNPPVFSGDWERQADGRWRFRKTNGKYVTDEMQLLPYYGRRGEYDTYSFDKDGYMQTGWVYDRRTGKWYLFKESGAMAYGWQWWEGKYYFLYDDLKDPCRGEMLRNTTVNGYRLGNDGACIENN